MRYLRILLQAGLIAWLCLVPGTALTPVAAANKTNTLVIVYLAPLVPPKPICVGEKTTYGIQVEDTNGIPVSGADVTVDGNKAATSGRGGSAQVPYTPQEDGKFTIQISADKSGYGNAPAQEIQGEAQICGWLISLEYSESVWTQANFFTGDCWLKFQKQPFNVDKNNNLVSDQGDIPAQFACNGGGLEFPLGTRMSPDIQGTVNVKLSGTFTKGNLVITLQALKIGLPEQVNIQVVDTYQGKDVGSPVTWGMYPSADVVNQFKIVNWNANPVFDYKIVKPAKSLFFAESGLSYTGDVTVIVQRQKSGK